MTDKEKEKKVVRTPEKPNRITRAVEAVRRYFRETIGELRKVNWPSRQEAINLTQIVLAVIVLMTVFLGILDLVFTRIFALLLSA